MIPIAFTQELLNRVDIVEVIGRYVPLKKSGANWMGLCPFHQEKSPSFSVSDSKQFYYCFGCTASGSAINFLMSYVGLGFVEAVKELAQQTGMVLPESDPNLSPEQRAHQRTLQAEGQQKKRDLIDVLRLSSDFFRRQLKDTQKAKDYLIGRGVSGEIAAHFGLGYAPKGWQNLRTCFPNDDAILVEAGLVIEPTTPDDEGREGRRYDRFRDRIMFPILDMKGQVIAFGGRVLDSGEPKYLNSPETPLFQKGETLYGLYEARQAIRDAGYVLVAEGYMDVVALAQHGFPQVVATLGTACTPTHVRTLLRQTDRIIFSFDGDNAGRRAAHRALLACLPHMGDDKTIQFLFLPKEHDPDSFVRSCGAHALEQAIQTAMPLSQCLLSTVTNGLDLQTLEGRARAQFHAKPLLQTMPPTALRWQLVRELAQLTQTTPADIEGVCELSHVRPLTRDRRPPPRSPRAAPTGLERQVIRLLIAHPSLASELDAAAVAMLTDTANEHSALLNDLLSTCQSLGKEARFAQFALLVERQQALQADHESDYPCLSELTADLSEIAAAPTSDLHVARVELTGAMRQMHLKKLKHALSQLVAGGLKAAVDQQQFRALMQQQQQLRQMIEEKT